MTMISESYCDSMPVPVDSAVLHHRVIDCYDIICMPYHIMNIACDLYDYDIMHTVFDIMRYIVRMISCGIFMISCIDE
jgi:hypothetical protein